MFTYHYSWTRFEEEQGQVTLLNTPSLCTVLTMSRRKERFIRGTSLQGLLEVKFS